MKKFLSILIIVLGIAYGGAEFATAGYAEKAIVQAAKEKDPSAQNVEAHVSKPLIFGLLTSSLIKQVKVSTSHLKLGPVVSERATATLDGVRVNVGESMSNKKVVVDSVDRLTMELEVTDEAVSALLPQGFSFEFADDGVTLRGPGAAIKGRLEFESPSSVRFRPDRGALPPGIDPSWSVADIPLTSCFEGDEGGVNPAVSIELQPGLARITCSQDHPPVEFLQG